MDSGAFLRAGNITRGGILGSGLMRGVGKLVVFVVPPGAHGKQIFIDFLTGAKSHPGDCRDKLRSPRPWRGSAAIRTSYPQISEIFTDFYRLTMRE